MTRIDELIKEIVYINANPGIGTGEELYEKVIELKDELEKDG